MQISFISDQVIAYNALERWTGLLLQPMVQFALINGSNLLLLVCGVGGGAFGRGPAMADGVFTPTLDNGVYFLQNNVSMHLECTSYGARNSYVFIYLIFCIPPMLRRMHHCIGQTEGGSSLLLSFLICNLWFSSV